MRPDADYLELISALWQLVTLRTLQYRARCDGTVRDTKMESDIINAINRVDAAEEHLKQKHGYTGPRP